MSHSAQLFPPRVDACHGSPRCKQPVKYSQLRRGPAASAPSSFLLRPYVKTTKFRRVAQEFDFRCRLLTRLKMAVAKNVEWRKKRAERVLIKSSIFPQASSLFRFIFCIAQWSTMMYFSIQKDTPDVVKTVCLTLCLQPPTDRVLPRPCPRWKGDCV